MCCWVGMAQSLTRMRISIVMPQAASTRTGNRHTAQRYGAFLRGAGHRVRIATAWDGRDCDLLIALHARKSHESLARFRARFPDRPAILVLTGTDLYRDIRTDASSQVSLNLATRIVVLQDEGRRELPPPVRRKVRVIYQSAQAERRAQPVRRFRICVIGHLRDEKDPFRTALALRHLPRAIAVDVVHLGEAL